MPAETVQQPDEDVTATAPTAADAALLAALRAGDEAAFAALVDRYHADLLRLAQFSVGDRAVAEEVVQETWLGLLRGLDRFEGRASLRTWLFRILLNTAQSRRQRERRSVPFSSLPGASPDAAPAVDPARFQTAAQPWPGHWQTPPRSWAGEPEARLLAAETQHLVTETIAGLPAAQQQVIRLRDLHGWTPGEVCAALGLSDAHQRVLLHRARARVRRALERYLDEE
jgi:RNA polymerase sigma-70 factor (ECF subfamily)